MLKVSTLTIGSQYTNVKYKSYVVEISGVELEIDLILLDIKDFDVTLGMT